MTVSSPAPAALGIDYVADVACPWCYIGWIKLKRTLALRPQVDAQIRWRPYQLNPELPEEGVDRETLMAARFPDLEQVRAIHAKLMQRAAEDGIDLNLDEVRRSPNTNAAHRLIVWAEMEGKGADLAEAVMRAYWSELRDIGDTAVLADIAEENGMDRATVERRYAEGKGKSFVDQACESAARSGISSVPFMIFGGRVAVSGAHNPEDLVKAVDKALEMGG